MKKDRRISSLLFSIIGIWLLIAPMLFELYHSFSEYHIEKELCTEQTTHFHQKPIDCSLCDFHPVFYTYEFLDLDIQEILYYYTTNFQFFASILEQKRTVQYHLRAPPLFG